jgi:hypothetical protein
MKAPSVDEFVLDKAVICDIGLPVGRSNDHSA